MSRTLSGLFLVGALRPRKRKRTNRENPRTIPEQIGKIPEKSGKSQKRTKKEGQVQIGKPPRLKPPRLAALDFGNFQKNPRVRKIRVRDSGARNGCAIFTDAWKNASVLQENLHVHKIPRFGGGGVFWFCGGGSADFIFMGARIFLKFEGSPHLLMNLSVLARTFTRLTRVPGLSAGCVFHALFLPPTQENKQKMPRNGTFFSARKPGCAQLW